MTQECAQRCVPGVRAAATAVPAGREDRREGGAQAAQPANAAAAAGREPVHGGSQRVQLCEPGSWRGSTPCNSTTEAVDGLLCRQLPFVHLQ